MRHNSTLPTHKYMTLSAQGATDIFPSIDLGNAIWYPGREGLQRTVCSVLPFGTF